MLTTISASFSRNVDIDLGSGDRHTARHKAHLTVPLAHDHGCHVGRPAGVAGQLYPFQVNAVPDWFTKDEFLVKLQVDGMIGSHLDVLILLDISTFESQHPRLKMGFITVSL